MPAKDMERICTPEDVRECIGSLRERSSPGAERLADALQAALDGAGQFEHLAGLRSKFGRSLPNIEVRRRRDEIFRQIARQFFNQLSTRAQAEAIAKQLDDYHRRGWRSDRASDVPPRGDELKVLLWSALSCRDRPIKVDQIYNILRGSPLALPLAREQGRCKPSMISE